MGTLDTASLGQISAAVGALGLAASSLVDGSKALPGGGISKKGFDSIEAAVDLFLPNEPTPVSASALAKPGKPAPSPSARPTLANSILQTLQSHWINGMALDDQKAIAKSLVKLKLTPETADTFAKATDVDAQALAGVATAMTTGAALTTQQANTLGRFDLALTAILDSAYQRADQRYRNVSKLWSSIVAVALSVAGAWILDANAGTGFSAVHAMLSLVVGIVAVPLAPVAKDLTSAISAGVKVAQSLRR